MSRLMQRLKAMDAQADPKRRAERESHQLAGDGLEMAARVALESWQERPRHPDESDVFRLGYRLACHELALVFRAMRKGEPPSRQEFEELRRLVFEDAEKEDSCAPMLMRLSEEHRKQCEAGEDPVEVLVQQQETAIAKLMKLTGDLGKASYLDGDDCVSYAGEIRRLLAELDCTPAPSCPPVGEDTPSTK